MHDLTLQSLPVLTDGGSRDGRLVLADGQLVAVFVWVTADETASGGQRSSKGWFLEAGFGPCSDLMAVAPPLFASLDEAQAWVRKTIDAELVSKSR